MFEFDTSGLTGEQPYLYHWILERENARRGYEHKWDKPWSKDPILQTYRFCNVHRENDKVTKWISKHWRKRDPHPNMIIAMVAARTINWPDTLEVIGFPSESSALGFNMWREFSRSAMKVRRERGDKVWTGAYLVSTNGHSMDKIDYILDKVWTPIYERFDPRGLSTLRDFHAGLTKFDGMGSFMAAQVVADLKHTSVLKDALDWETWAAIGPGSKRGLNRYFGRKLEGPIKEVQFLGEVNILRLAIAQRCGIALHAQDVQNCLCEYDKFCRVKNNEGKPRSLYSGK